MKTNMKPSLLRRRFGAAFVALSLAPLPCMSACIGSSSSATNTVTASVSDGKSATITIENGDIDVIKDPNAKGVEISARIRCYGRDQAEADARLKGATLVAQRDADGKVDVSVSIPKRATGSWINLRSDETQITVRAADLSGIVATTSNGSITLDAFKGEAKLETSNGGIAVNGHNGPVHADTSNGSIRINGAQSAFAETSNGNIDVTLAEGAVGDLRLETSNGSVVLDLSAAWQGTVSAETSLGTLSLPGGDVSGKRNLKTTTIGDGAKATAKVTTSLGSVTVRRANQ